MAYRQVARHINCKSNFLFFRQLFHRRVDSLHDVLERVIGERKNQLPRFYLRQVEYFVDEA